MATVDLNADMGESYGPWKMGNDDILLDIVTSANIACGFHAGDPNIMLSTMKMAAEKDVGIGAHPGFHDIEGFGRNRLSIPIGTLQNQVRYQVGAALGMARAAGTTVRHIKLHGAMSNMASEDADMAYALYDAALSVAPEATIMVLAATAHQEAAEKLGCKWVGEIFADRAYNDEMRTKIVIKRGVRPCIRTKTHPWYLNFTLNIFLTHTEVDALNSTVVFKH